MTKKGNRLQYQIDENNRLSLLDRQWDTFAIENDADGLAGNKLLDHSIWDFITDTSVCYLYEQIFQRVRSGKKVLFDFRCDAPDLRRFMQMYISPTENGGVQFETLVQKIEPRKALMPFDPLNPSTDRIVVSCSWCNKIRVDETQWEEIEIAADLLRLFERPDVPHISHGMCPECFESVLQNLERS